MPREGSRVITAFLDGVPIARVRVGASTWTPPVDVWETPTEVVVVAEIAGVDDQSLEVHFEGRELAIRGTRPEPFAVPEQRICQHQMELSYGHFERILTIPVPIDPNRIEAKHRNGLLEIRCAKLKRPGRVRVAVTSEGDG